MAAETLETITRRMIRNISRMWGYHEMQDINSFDPVLRLLTGAFAEEIRRISREITVTDARIVEKMIDVLFGQSAVSHIPAHAIATVMPSIARTELQQNVHFSCRQPTKEKDPGSGSGQLKSVTFTPVKKNILIKGDIRYVATDSFLYEQTGYFREMIAENKNYSQSNCLKLYLGLRLDPEVVKLDGLSFFFNSMNISSNEKILEIIQSAAWQINGMTVHFLAGHDALIQETRPFKEQMDNQNNLTFQTEQFISGFYRNHFMYLQENDVYCNAGPEKKHFVPPNVQDLINISGTGIDAGRITWVEIQLPRFITHEELNDMIMLMNCFPVVNRQLNEQTHTLVKGANVISLLTDDLFFDVDNISDSRGNEYFPEDSLQIENSDKRGYMLRQGGVARFDTRNAREIIDQLIALLRDESAAFALKGSDILSYELKQLDQIISRLQQRVQYSGNSNDQNNYLLLSSKSDFEKIYVRFWSTQGDLANQIRPGTKISVLHGADIDEKSALLVTRSSGARIKMTKDEKITKLRRSILSGERVVTREDIRVLCFDVFSSDLEQVKIRKGAVAGTSHNQGIKQTIDIVLMLKNEQGINPDDLYYKTNLLKMKLEQESLNLLPYRILFENIKE